MGIIGLIIRLIGVINLLTKSPSPPSRESHEEIYPFRVLRGLEGVRIGTPVELQWKMCL